MNTHMATPTLSNHIAKPTFTLALIMLALTLGGCDSQSSHIALGTLERDRIAHSATTNEVITDLPIKRGSQVKKGDVLVQLDSTLQNAQVAKAQASVMQAQAQLDKLRNGARNEEIASAKAQVEGAKATLLESQSSYQRSRDLLKQKLISQASHDTSLAQRDAAKAKVKSTSEALLTLTNGTRIEDLHMAEANLAAATALLNIETKKLADLTITATRDGTLDNLPWNLGERVTMGSPLAIVLAGIAPYARIYVPEPLRANLQLGDELTINIDGRTDSLIGTVRWIASSPAFTPYYALNQQERSRLMYLTEVQLPATIRDLPNGLPVQVTLP